MNEVKWIYYCRPTRFYACTYCDRAEFESEDDAIKWCEEKAREHRGVSFEYLKSCYVRVV